MGGIFVPDVLEVPILKDDVKLALNFIKTFENKQQSFSVSFIMLKL